MISKTFCENYLSAFDPQIQKIEQAADHILRHIGLDFEGDPDTLEMWRSQGAHIDQNRVYLDGAQLRDIIRATAPQNFGVVAQSAAHDCCIGKDHPPMFAPIYGAPNVLTSDGQRIAGSRALYRDLVALADSTHAITNTGQMICVMNDVPEQERPAEMAHAHLDGSKKPLMGSVASPQAVIEVINMVRANTDRPDTKPDWPVGFPKCQLLHLINSTPPLTYKANALKCLREVARNNEGCIITSYMMLGATGPTTVAGAVASGYAECLAGLALAQLWQPGTPVVMGLFAAPFSMQHMQPLFGDPLSQNVQFYSVALARHLGVPARGDGGITNALMDDAQAGYEGGRNINAALMAGSDFVLHAAGWLEGGRCVSFEKFAREADALDQWRPQ